MFMQTSIYSSRAMYSDIDLMVHNSRTWYVDYIEQNNNDKKA